MRSRHSFFFCFVSPPKAVRCNRAKTDQIKDQITVFIFIYFSPLLRGPRVVFCQSEFPSILRRRSSGDHAVLSPPLVAVLRRHDYEKTAMCSSIPGVTRHSAKENNIISGITRYHGFHLVRVGRKTPIPPELPHPRCDGRWYKFFFSDRRGDKHASVSRGVA